MTRLLQATSVRPSESTEARVHALEERIDHLAKEEEHLQQLEEDIERRVEHLTDELTAVRELAQPAHGPPSAASQPQPSHSWTARRVELESWFGRYGALALASFTILLGVGVFISWAILSDRLGPWVRVSVGALAAATLAFVGWHLRERNAERFGNVLMALALAIFQVDAWGAGPRLHLVPHAGSLIAAALASAALVWLAVREREEVLFNVGFGGALVAPFVTSTVLDAEATWRLLAYGLIVLTPGLVAARWQVWRHPPWVFVVGSWVYTAWTAEATSSADFQLAVAPGIFALLCSWFALALIRGPAAGRTAIATLVIATAFVAGRVFDSGASTRYSAIAAAVGLSSLAASRRDAQVRRAPLLGVALIPALTLWFALIPLENELKSVRVLTAIAWAACCIASTWRLPPLTRNVGFATAALCAGAVCPIVFDERSLELTLSLSAYSACAALAMARLQVPGIAAGSVIWLAVATLAGYRDLAERVNYVYTPFMTLPSLGALAYSIAWIVTYYLLRQLREYQPYRFVEELVGIATAFAVFAWGRQELAGAFSPDAAVFALIVYYALFGVALIYVSGLRESLHMRPAGLALSIYATLKAFFEASQLDIGFRVGAFLFSGIFLLAVAYWYQRSMTPDTTGAARDPHARLTG